jgi:hypothetical protein
LDIRIKDEEEASDEGKEKAKDYKAMLAVPYKLVGISGLAVAGVR